MIAGLCLCHYAAQSDAIQKVRACKGIITFLYCLTQQFPFECKIRNILFDAINQLIHGEDLDKSQASPYISELALALKETAKILSKTRYLNSIYDLQCQIIESIKVFAQYECNHKEILEGEGLQSLLVLINNPGTDNEVKIAALAVLHQFDIPVHELSLHLKPVIPVLYILLTYSNITLQEQSLRLLARLNCPCCSQQDIGKVSIFKAKALADLLERGSLQVQLDSVVVITRIAQSSTANKEMLQGTKIIEKLIKLLDEKDLDLQRPVVAALHYLASENADKKDRNSHEVVRVAKICRDQTGKAIPKIVALLESSDKGMQCVAVAALSTSAFNHAENQAKLIAEEGVFPRMLELLKTGDDDVKSQVAGTLLDVSFNDSLKDSIPILRAMLKATMIGELEAILARPSNPQEVIDNLRKVLSILRKEQRNQATLDAQLAASIDTPPARDFKVEARKAGKILEPIHSLQSKLKDSPHLSTGNREALRMINEDNWVATASEYAAATDKAAFVADHPDFLETLTSVHDALLALDALHIAEANKAQAVQLQAERDAETRAAQIEKERIAAQEAERFKTRVSNMQKACIKFNARVQMLKPYQGDREFAELNSLLSGKLFKRTQDIANSMTEMLTTKVRAELVTDPEWFNHLKNHMMTAEQTLIRLEAIVARRAEEATLAAAIRAADAADAAAEAAATTEAASTAVPAVAADDLLVRAAAAVASAGSDDDSSYDSALEPAIAAPGVASPVSPAMAASPDGASSAHLWFFAPHEDREKEAAAGAAVDEKPRTRGQIELDNALTLYGYHEAALSPELEAVSQFYEAKFALVQTLVRAGTSNSFCERTLWAHMGFSITPLHFEQRAIQGVDRCDLIAFLYFKESGQADAENRSFACLQTNMHSIDFDKLAAKNNEQVVQTIKELLHYLSTDLSQAARKMVVADLVEASQRLPSMRKHVATDVLTEIRNAVFHDRPLNPEQVALAIQQIEAALVVPILRAAAEFKPVTAFKLNPAARSFIPEKFS